MKKVSCYDELPEWRKELNPVSGEEMTSWVKNAISGLGGNAEEIPGFEDLIKSEIERQKRTILMLEARSSGAYIFTDAEKRSIEKILKSKKTLVTQESLRHFIWELEGIASQKKYEILDTPKKTDTRTARQEIIADGKTFLKHLDVIISCKRQWVTYDDLESGGGYIQDDDEFIDGRFNNPATHIKFKVWGLADKIRQPMFEMLSALEKFNDNEIKTHGRPRADADNFVKLVADAYSRHIGKPTTYNGGIFFKIVECILMILEMHIEDPTRAVKQALKK